MKKLLLILLCLPIIGFGEIKKVDSETIRECNNTKEYYRAYYELPEKDNIKGILLMMVMEKLGGTINSTETNLFQKYCESKNIIFKNVTSTHKTTKRREGLYELIYNNNVLHYYYHYKEELINNIWETSFDENFQSLNKDWHKQIIDGLESDGFELNFQNSNNIHSICISIRKDLIIKE